MALRPVDTSAAYAAHSLPTVAAVRPLCLRNPSAGCLRYSMIQQVCSTAVWGSGVPGLRTAGHQTRLGAHVSRARKVAARALAAPGLTAPAAGPDPWHTLAVLSTCAAVSQLLEAHTKWGAMLSAPLLALTTALAAAALGLLPPVSAVYDAVWRYLMPLAVALYLLDHDISSLARSGGQVLVSFLLGAGTMVVGAWCAWHLLGTAALGVHGAQLACCLLASYIGGSVNFAAVAAATGLPSALMPAAVAADNLAMLVLLGIMMATPARSMAALIAGQQLAMPSPATAGHRLPPSAAFSEKPSSSSSSNATRSGPRLHDARPARPAVGLDGQPLLTQPPDPADLAACMTASAQGRAAVRSSIYKSSGSYKQHALSHRAAGQHVQDRKARSTPTPTSTAALRTPAPVAAGVSKPGQVASRSHSSKGNSSSIDTSSFDSIHSSRLSRKCGGCRASGITALDANPLLTRAPAMADAITNINAAHVGKHQVKTGPPPGSSSSTGDTTLDFPDDGVVGCGCCEEALNAMAEVSNRGSPFESSSSGGSSGPQRSGALALDGGLLLTDEPSEDQVAAALAAAKAGRKVKSANVSVSGSALSSLASTDSDELELVVRFNWKEFQQNLKREQQLLQQEEEAKKQQQQQWQQQAVLPVDWEKISVSSSVDSSSGDSDSESWGLSDSSTAPAARATPTVAATAGTSGSAVAGSGVSLTSSSGAAALAAAAISCAAGQAAATSLGVPALQLLMVSYCAVGLSVAGHMLFRAFSNQQQQQQQQIAPHARAAVAGPYAGASQLGQLLMGVFFATLGASCCCSWSSFLAAAPQFAFVIIMVLVHWCLLAVIGRALGAGGLNLLPLSNEVLMVGSAANVGGPATAAALASAKGWQGLVQPALLCGSLGYALGTAGGILLARGLGVL